MKSKALATIKIYWANIRKRKMVFFGLAGLAIAAASIETIIPIYFKRIIDVIAAPGVKGIMYQAAFGLLLTAAALSFIRWALWRVAVILDIRLVSRSIAEMNNDSFRHLHRQSFSFFSNNFSGTLVKRVNYFTRAFENITDNFFWNLLPMIVNMVIIITVLCFRNVAMGLATLVWLIIFFTLNFFFANWKYKYDIMETEAISKTTGFLSDTITNFSSIKLFNGNKRENKSYSDLTEDTRKKMQYAWSTEEIFNGTSSFLMIVLEFGLLIFAIRLWRQGLFTPGDFVLVQAYVILIIDQSWQFGRMVRNFYRSFSDAEEMTTLLQTTPEIVDRPGAKELKVSEGKIEFSKVVFCYHETRKILANFNLTIKAGEKIALIGPSGAGKTTVIKLLLRNFDLTGGHILIDGQDIAGVTQESLWKNISLVPQDPVLFHRNLKENIRYGRPGASDAEVIKASKLAHCHEFIADLPKGYDTFVGERGIKLSGGERQRVAIARAILRNAPILVLDEATSSLDSESEGLIQDALEKLMKDKTVIVIAHRLSTIRKMDRIIFIDEGKIKEEGTHQELENKPNGLYRHLWELQAGGFME
ncbi:MAG: ABC transporter ATP-binding protein [Patescibacteria group bacterium]|nr:ABC transporter ATP-binding protein [Patescibacteria group bacterium]